MKENYNNIKNEKSIIVVNRIKFPTLETLVSGQISKEILNNQFAIFAQFSNPSFFAKILVFQKILFDISGAEYGNYSQTNIKNHLVIIKKELYNLNKDGFVSLQNLEVNKVINAFRTVFHDVEVFFVLEDDKKLRYTIFLMNHIFNIVILLLNVEVKMANNGKMKNEISEELELDVLDMLGKVTIGVRKELTTRHLSFYNKIYSGFDTEYETEEIREVDLLCYTLSVYSRSFIRYKPTFIDYTIDAEGKGEARVPRPISEFTAFLVKVLRELNGKGDEVVKTVVEELNGLVSEGTLVLIKGKNGECFYSLPRDIKTLFKQFQTAYFEDVEKYSFKKLVEESVLLIDSNIRNDYDRLRSYILGIFMKHGTVIEPVKTRARKYDTKLLKYKSLYRKGLKIVLESGGEILISGKVDITFLCHYSSADVGTLKDFEEFKPSLTLMNKGFVTMKNPLKIEGFDVHMRDTSFLTVSGGSLAAVGALYEAQGLEKIKIDRKWYSAMRQYRASDPESFREYAIVDSTLSLYHGLVVEESNQKETQRLQIPLTISSMAGKIMEGRLLNSPSSYHPPTLNGKFSVKNLTKLYTPKGINLSGGLVDYLSFFLGSYRGGRNESYKYGSVEGTFYDYDLSGAYPTAMSMLQYPDFSKLERVSQLSFSTLEPNHNWSKTYSSFKVSFTFPDTVKYPNIPVTLSETTTVFPLSGVSICTGIELELAHKLGCIIQIHDGVIIPFTRPKNPQKAEATNEEPKEEIVYEQSQFLSDFLNHLSTEIKKFINKRWLVKDNEKHLQIVEEEEASFVEKEITIETYKEGIVTPVTSAESKDTVKKDSEEDSFSPFYNLVKWLVQQRKQHPKRTYYNELYKFIANSGIGQMGRGLSDKKALDINKYSIPISSGELTSPLYAGWITAFIRTSLSELLNWVHSNDGVIVSSTTDGFITSYKDLENFTTTDFSKKGLYFTAKFANYREKLGFDPKALELKYTEDKGIISIKTRGQIGISSDISALTGFNKFYYPKDKLAQVFSEKLLSDKKIRFPANRLASAVDIVKKGGHVTMIPLERDYKLVYDNKRRVTEPVNIGDNGFYHDTTPFTSTEISSFYRDLDTMTTAKYSNKHPWTINLLRDKDTFQRAFIRNLIRLMYQSPGNFGAERFERDDIQKVIQAVFGASVSLNYISKQKRCEFLPHAVPKTATTVKFSETLKSLYPTLDANVFFSK